MLTERYIPGDRHRALRKPVRIAGSMAESTNWDLPLQNRNDSHCMIKRHNFKCARLPKYAIYIKVKPF
jgi:hypothetical protein